MGSLAKMKSKAHAPPEVRFWRFVDRTNGDCWLWTGQRTRSGYGTFGIAKRTSAGAHRYSYRIHKGEIGVGMFVCHRCNTKLCVNPDHLYLAAPLQNSRDAAKDGLLARKLDDKTVRAIRELYATGGTSYSALAARYGVAKSLIWAVVKARNWTHVTPC